MKNIIKVITIVLILSSFQSICAIDFRSYISTKKQKNAFALSVSGKSTPLVVSSQDYPGVMRVIKQLQRDVANVTNSEPVLSIDKIPESKEIVLVGTIGKSPLINKLIQDKKLDVKEIQNKRETFLITIIEKPFKGVDRALIITGSDKRGTIYGMYDLSTKIGVSPWYWWADVPVKKQSQLFVLAGRYTQGEPKVKYRGIFINDEMPALGGMVNEKFGGFNSKFYEHVFELILRLKGNFLWPAMWDNSFATDDILNPKLADEYGVVMSTSHHEPMMRAWKEWEREGNKKGSWDYSKNPAKLREFWKEGIQRTKDYEKVVTLAMRGDGDEPMTEDANINVLQKIVTDQRQILSEVTGKDATAIPQVWALYKEVQDYYDKGMRVPDDVTILLCDDNWGNIRKLPNITDKPHPGGYGIYYHFDYVGGPRNYKWLNTNQIERTWEQMHLAYEYGARQIWIVNVGDIKPMELPISFFLDYAWNPDEWTADKLPEYTRMWAEQQFGKKYSNDVAEILEKYTKYNSRRKPELLSPETYSLVNYREAETVVADYNKIADKAQHIYDSLPAEYKDAFYQLVLHPASACANLNELYVTVAKNHLYSLQGRALTNDLAEKAKELYNKDSLISLYYNKTMANGKWNHMMDQTHIGYTYWQQPDYNSMPRVKKIEIPSVSDMGVAIEGSEKWWPLEKTEAALPEFDKFNQQSFYIDIFNRGNIPFKYSVEAKETWIKIDYKNGMIDKEKRLFVSVDWKKAPIGKSKVPIIITGPNNSEVVVLAPVFNPSFPKRDKENYFIESDGYVSIEAEHFSKAVGKDSISWLKIPNMGRTSSAVAPMPVTVSSQTAGGKNPHLEYQVYLFEKGEINVKTYFSPTLNFHNKVLRCAVSFDDEAPEFVDIHINDIVPDWKYPKAWNDAVSDNIKIESSKHLIDKPGRHVLKIWMVDPGIALQKIVIHKDDIKPGYLGPTESFNGKLFFSK